MTSHNYRDQLLSYGTQLCRKGDKNLGRVPAKAIRTKDGELVIAVDAGTLVDDYYISPGDVAQRRADTDRRNKQEVTKMQIRNTKGEVIATV